MLWFAFRMYLWFIAIQQCKTFAVTAVCCDLLSECIFDLLLSNLKNWHSLLAVVVICFQNVSLIYCYPTGCFLHDRIDKLWFAFRMYLWFIAIQQCCSLLSQSASCDLLSECIFDLLLSNYVLVFEIVLQVVICFQNVSLIYCYPTKIVIGTDSEGCDLLSECIFDLLLSN